MVALPLAMPMAMPMAMAMAMAMPMRMTMPWLSHGIVAMLWLCLWLCHGAICHIIWASCAHHRLRSAVLHDTNIGAPMTIMVKPLTGGHYRKKKKKKGYG